ncbi:MAG TPA: hypothetical protein VIC06_13360 [Solirubrobacteraceae bacterium]
MSVPVHCGCSPPRVNRSEIPLPDIPWPERVLAARLQDGSEIVNVHSPTSPKPELAKTRTHEAVFAHLANPAPQRLRVLCGDLNTPRKEHADGTIWTFARDQYGRLRPDRGEAWDRAELALIQGLHAYGFHDCLPAAARLPAARAQLGMAALGRRLQARPPAHIRAVAGHELPLPAPTAQGGAIRSLPAARPAPASRRAHSRIVSHGAKRAKTTNTNQKHPCSHTRSKPHDTKEGRMAELSARDGKLVQYLNEAYGKEKELETALQAHIGMTTRAPYKKRLR